MDISRRLTSLLQLDQEAQLLQYRGIWTTIGDLRRHVTALEELLTQCGFGPASRIGLVTRNRPGHVAAIVAVLSSARCLVPITSIQSESATLAEIERLGVGVVIADQEDLARPGLVQGCTANGVHVFGLPTSPGDDVTPVRMAADPRDVTPAPGVAVLMPTSGTTGPPKRVSYTYTQINGALERVSKYAPATTRALGGPVELRRGVFLAPLALAHVAGLWGVLQALAEGRRIALMDRFDTPEWARLVAEHSVVMAQLPPATVKMVIDADIDPALIRSVRAVICGTAPLDPAVAEAFTAKYGIPVLTLYGATEFPGGLVGWTLADHTQFHGRKHGSVGRARPGIAIRIVDAESGKELPPGAKGLVSVLSPQATTRTETGWVVTTDYGRMDDDGFLWILGRADDAINRGGFKIIPQVVEAALRAHPAVDDAAVVGIADNRLGQVPVAAVTVTDKVTPAELDAWARESLSRYQVPVEIRIVDALPRTVSLKIAKDGVRALFGAAS